MVAKIDIANRALNNVGRAPITSLEEVPLLEDTYDIQRRALLEAHPWNFATKRVSLNKQTTMPVFGWAGQYTLPADFIRLVMTEEEETNAPLGDPLFNGFLTISFSSSFAKADDYRVEDSPEGKILLSNDDIKRIIYVFDQEDSQRFSSTFVTLLAKAISATMAYKLTGSRTLADDEKRDFEKLFKSATTIDGQQSKIRRIETSVFRGSRI